MVEQLQAPRADGDARAFAALGRTHSEGFAPRIWRLRTARPAALGVSRGRYGIFQRLPRDRAAAFAASRAAADWRVQSSHLPQRARRSGRRDAGVSRSECALDGPHALRDVPLVARAHGRTPPAAGERSQVRRNRGPSHRAARRRDTVFLAVGRSWLVVGSANRPLQPLNALKISPSSRMKTLAN